ncbi:MAG: response regulator [Candidatus Levybacteria bacterium]|nr:response regulator [Candidatus Levybacteria bacterium]
MAHAAILGGSAPRFNRDLTTPRIMAKILLVDDDQDLSVVFSTALKKAGFEVVTAATGEDGLSKAKTENPNLILFDQILPDIKGNEALKKLKEDPQTQSIPVVLLSNFGQNELIQEAKQKLRVRNSRLKIFDF